MCGLFGFTKYGNEKIKGLSELTNSLSEQSAVRGTDATGISYCSTKGLEILKESKAAYMLSFKHPDDIGTLTGHTRRMTVGNPKNNRNNHPFKGSCKNLNFALCHNGVLSNDKSLRNDLNLPKTKIETDSYIAVQLLESQPQLNFDSIKYMAEKTEGSFSYTILDEKNNLYLVKGDSPLSILHFPKQKIYVYASTDSILYKALVDSPLFSSLKKGECETVEINEGDILKITPDGNIVKRTFEFSYYYGKGWWNYGCYPYSFELTDNSAEDEYLTELRTFAGYQGIDVDELLNNGFSLQEIEDYIYEF